MSRFALEVQDLVKIYRLPGGKSVRAVDGMSFTVAPGTIFGLLGPNGAGKSTLLRILTTLTRPTSGSARILGIDLLSNPLEVRRHISSVLQEPAAELLLNVRDNLLTFARFHGIARSVAVKRAVEAMNRFQLTPFADRKVQDLSGGYRRRVQVAKVFMVETAVIFLDEFSSGMDPLLKREVIAQLRAESRNGRTIVLTTQILSEAEELCDDILIMNQGRQVARGDLNSLKMLSRDVYEISMTFDRMPEGIDREIAALETLRTRFHQNTIEFTLKAPEGGVLDVVTNLSRNRRVLRVELNGASLEDIFVELMQGGQ